MKIAIITDTHLGSHNGSAIFRDYFKEWFVEVFFPILEKHQIKNIVHGGDFFDDRVRVKLGDLDLAMWFVDQLEQKQITMDLILGNHDVAYRNTNRIYSPKVIEQSPMVTVYQNGVTELEHLKGKYNFFVCPWLNVENSKTTLEQIKHHVDPNSILLGHFSINGVRMYRNSKVCETGLDQALFKQYGQVWSGHFHTPSQYGNIKYLGAAFHLTWQDYNDWRGFHIFDTETGELDAIENEACLFDRFEFEDVLELDQHKYDDFFNHKILKIELNEPYDRLQLKETINRIEQCNPISVDVIDNTILPEVTNDDQPDLAETKDLMEYFHQYLNDQTQYDELEPLLKHIHSEAEKLQLIFE